MQFVVRFDRQGDSTGPDVVTITADRYTESYHEGALSAYRFFDGDGREIAMVRAARVTYVAAAGAVVEPAAPHRPVAPEAGAIAGQGE